MTGQASHFAWKRNFFAGSCVAMALGALACTGQIGSGGSPSSGTGGAGSDPMTNPPGGTGGGTGAGTGGRPGGTGAGMGTGTGGGTGAGTGGSSGTGGAGAGTGGSSALTLDNGRTVIRRLNRTEYNLTVRDLLGTSMTPGDNLPAEPATDLFDTLGEFLDVAELQAETWEGAASALAAELFALPTTDPKRTKVFVCTLTTGAEATCARKILTTFARRAFRRPPAAAEIDSLMALIDKVRAGGTYNDGLQAAITAILLSPHFLYKEETSMGLAANAAAKPLNAYELATRLSYFLWSSMPDDALSASADSGKLVSDAELSAQVDRMLADAKAVTLTSNFARQWLTLYRLDPGISFDAKLFPAFNDDLRASAQQETATFFSHLISDNLPIPTLINADFTYANARLAKHYGLTSGAPTGTALARVSLAGTPRAGVLTQASYLMGNAHPDVTSPVQRGKWILERILCSPTPPPPMNVNTAFTAPDTVGLTARAQLEMHRADAVCASCHNFLDPLGVGLENFDAIGAYRTTDNGAPVDAHGMYPGSGGTFSSGAELAKLISQDARYPTCVTKNLLTYGAGRSFAASDALAYARGISERAMAAGGGNWRSWLSMIVSSDAFRTNRPDDPQ